MAERIKKKELIIKTAIKLFVENGFENTSTDLITQKANVAKGTLFYHFKTKNDLIKASYLYVKQQLKDFVYEEVVEGNEFKSTLKKLWISNTNWALNHKYEYEFNTLVNKSPYTFDVVEQTSEELFGDLKKVINSEIKKGTIKNWSFDVYRYIFLGIHQAFVLEFSKKTKVGEKELERSFDVFWDAIKL